jgi:hypothetical protein
MRWRVLIELTGADGSVRLDEVVSSGSRPVDPLVDSPVGLTLAERKTIRATRSPASSKLGAHGLCRGHPRT